MKVHFFTMNLPIKNIKNLKKNTILLKKECSIKQNKKPALKSILKNEKTIKPVSPKSLQTLQTFSNQSLGSHKSRVIFKEDKCNLSETLKCKSLESVSLLNHTQQNHTHPTKTQHNKNTSTQQKLKHAHTHAHIHIY